MLRCKSPKRLTFSPIDRLIFAELYRPAPGVLDALTIIKPETVIRWARDDWPGLHPAACANLIYHRDSIASGPEQLSEPDQYYPILALEWQSDRLAPAQHDDLLPKHDDLCLQRGSRSKQIGKDTKSL